jgi:hypothetical protein
MTNVELSSSSLSIEWLIKGLGPGLTSQEQSKDLPPSLSNSEAEGLTPTTYFSPTISCHPSLTASPSLTFHVGPAGGETEAQGGQKIVPEQTLSQWTQVS